MPVLPNRLYGVGLHMRIRFRICVAYRLKFVYRVCFVCHMKVWSGLVF